MTGAVDWRASDQGVWVRTRSYAVWRDWFYENDVADDDWSWTHTNPNLTLDNTFDTYVLIKDPKVRMLFKLAWGGR